MTLGFVNAVIGSTFGQAEIRMGSSALKTGSYSDTDGSVCHASPRRPCKPNNSDPDQSVILPMIVGSKEFPGWHAR